MQVEAIQRVVTHKDDVERVLISASQLNSRSLQNDATVWHAVASIWLLQSYSIVQTLA